MVVDGTRVAHLEVEKNNLFGNISKTAEYFYLIVFGPHRRVLKTYSGIFRFGKIGKFSTQKSPNVFVFLKKISKTAQYFFLIVSGPHISVLKTYFLLKIDENSLKKYNCSKFFDN